MLIFCPNDRIILRATAERKLLSQDFLEPRMGQNAFHYTRDLLGSCLGPNLTEFNLFFTHFYVFFC